MARDQKQSLEETSLLWVPLFIHAYKLELALIEILVYAKSADLKPDGHEYIERWTDDPTVLIRGPIAVV